MHDRNRRRRKGTAHPYRRAPPDPFAVACDAGDLGRPRSTDPDSDMHLKYGSESREREEGRTNKVRDTVATDGGSIQIVSCRCKQPICRVIVAKAETARPAPGGRLTFVLIKVVYV
jgi:hypothetical protein